MQSWQLPEHIADILPSTARQLENAKERLLALFRVHGYELVSPPLLEYSDSLLTRIDEGLSLRTIRVVDQISGRQLGLRADITPQVARIDAHLLSANNGVNRLCYAGTVLHARPDGFLSTREPLQIGAELYGHAGVEADIELIELMLDSLQQVHDVRLALGHLGIFRALAAAAGLDAADSRLLLGSMSDKDAQAVREHCRQCALPAQWADAFTRLPTLYGNPEVIARARAILPPLPAIDSALNQLQQVCQAFAGRAIHIDLSELRVDSYHTGLLFAAYGRNWPDALARGGRYDGLGSHFGRARPATGFSFDLRDLIGHLPPASNVAGIAVSVHDAANARDVIAGLRQQGECVLIDYTPESAPPAGCDRRLLQQDGRWQVVPIG